MQNIWKKELTLEGINKLNENTLVSHLGIKITKIGHNSLEATMPVDSTTHQAFKLLHGGASCVLSETLGSLAANFCLESNEQRAVGQHIEATHLRPVAEGFVRGVAQPIHLGKSSQLWKIDIYNSENKLICDSKILMAVIKK